MFANGAETLDDAFDGLHSEESRERLVVRPTGPLLTERVDEENGGGRAILLTGDDGRGGAMKQLIADRARRLRIQAETTHQVSKPLFLARGSLTEPLVQRRAEGLAHLALDHDRNRARGRPREHEYIVL